MHPQAKTVDSHIWLMHQEGPEMKTIKSRHQHRTPSENHHQPNLRTKRKHGRNMGGMGVDVPHSQTSTLEQSFSDQHIVFSQIDFVTLIQ